MRVTLHLAVVHRRCDMDVAAIRHFCGVKFPAVGASRLLHNTGQHVNQWLSSVGVKRPLRTLDAHTSGLPTLSH